MTIKLLLLSKVVEDISSYLNLNFHEKIFKTHGIMTIFVKKNTDERTSSSTENCFR